MSTGGLLGGIGGGILGFVIGGGPVGALYGFGIGYGVGSYFDPITGEAAGQIEISELNITTAKEGVPIAEGLGTFKLTGNLIGYWRNRAVEVTQEVQSGGKGGGSSERVVSGHKYYLTWAVGLCMGPADMLYTIYEGDECVWEGELSRPVSGGEETITIPGIGSMTFYFGTDDQVANTTVGALLGTSKDLSIEEENPETENLRLILMWLIVTMAMPWFGAVLLQTIKEQLGLISTDEAAEKVQNYLPNPAYRHLCYAVFNDCFIGEYNRLPTFRFVIRKSPAYDFNDKQEVEVYDYNAAHAIWHILTEMVGLDESWLNEDSFISAANALYYENRGVTMLMDSQQEALTYLESLLAHIDGILRYGIDGKFHLKLLRADAIVEDLLVVDETMMLDDMTLSRKTWIDTINDLKVQYSLRYFGDECAGEEVQGDGQGGSGSGSPPVLTYLGCADETYLFPAVLGSYEITGGRGPWLLMYKNEDMDDWEVRRKLYARSFSSLCREIKCAGQEADQQMKLKDLGFDTDVYSNIVDISISEATQPMWGGDIDVDSGSSGVAIFTGGRPPYRWTLPYGNGLWFDAAHTLKSFITTVPGIYVFAEEGLCDDAVTITVREGCGKLETGVINIHQITFAADWGSTPATIDRGTSVEVYWTGGGPSYYITTSSNGYTVNYPAPTVKHTTVSCMDGVCDIDFDAVCVLEIYDSCGQHITMKLKNTEGDWIPKSQGWVNGHLPCRPGLYCWPTFGSCSPSSGEYVDGVQKWVGYFWPAPACYDPAAHCNWGDIPTWWQPAEWEDPPFSDAWDFYENGIGGVCSGCVSCAGGTVPKAELDTIIYYEWGCPP
jgi:hypothetical protein